MTLPTLALCALCQRKEPAVGHACWRCRDQVHDLLDPRNTGSKFDPERPYDPVVHPSIPALMARLTATRGSSGPAVGGTSSFRSTSPANDHVIALRDHRTVVEGEFDALAARYWLGWDTDELCHHPKLVEAVTDLRRLRSQLLALTGDALPRPVGRCWQLVDDDGHLIPEALVTAAFRAAALPPGVHGPAPWPVGLWRCNTALWMPHLPPRAADEPVRDLPTITCGGCTHPYRGVELVQLGGLDEAVAA